MENLHSVFIDPVKLVKARGDRAAAQVARDTGLSRQQLWNYENGLFKPSGDTVAKLCLHYGIQIKDLLSEPELRRSQKNLKKKKIAA